MSVKLGLNDCEKNVRQILNASRYHVKKKHLPEAKLKDKKICARKAKELH